MFILTIEDKETSGVYSVQDENGNQILYIFEEEDDANRYSMLMEEDYPDTNVLEIEGDAMMAICEVKGYNYTIITKNDIVVPPAIPNHDFI
jgi:hypothetical protein